MPPSLLQVRSKTVRILIHLNIVDECRSNILAPLSFSLPSLWEKRTPIIYILSFPRPFVRLGKVCQVWIWLHYCFLWLFRQWKVSKELVFFLIFIASQNLLVVHIYTLCYNFRSYVISTLIAVLFLPFGDQTCSEKQFQYWDWKIDIEFVWWCIVVVLSPQKSFFSFSGLSLLLRSNRLHSLSLQGTDFLYFASFTLLPLSSFSILLLHLYVFSSNWGPMQSWLCHEGHPWAYKR